jgi:hypothetical protein
MRRRATLLALLALACAAPAAHAQTTGTGNAVEPVPGQPAPAPTGTTTVPPVTTPPAVTTTPPVATAPAAAPAQPAAKDEGGKVSWLEIAAIALGALLLAVVVALLLWRVRGWDPRWFKRWRHAVAEAGWRLSLGFAEFRDFVKLGR